MGVLLLPPAVPQRRAWFGFLESFEMLFIEGFDLTRTFWPTACECNGRSQECYFDPELYRSTGHGGHCTNCQGNTDGANCERCRENFFRLGNNEACSPCHCSPVGEWQAMPASARWIRKTKSVLPVPPENKVLLPRRPCWWRVEVCTLLSQANDSGSPWPPTSTLFNQVKLSNDFLVCINKCGVGLSNGFV